MTIIGNSLFNAGATVDTSKDGSSASFQAAIGTTYEIDLSLSELFRLRELFREQVSLLHTV